MDRVLGLRLADTVFVRDQLQAQSQTWEGTPYMYGGIGRQGVDCSGFVWLTYRSSFGVALPRTVGDQIRVGTKISQGSLLPGDLLFFKTGFFDRHVGIYMGDSEFLHASNNRGVTISRLDQDYWRRKYWTARRIRL